MTVEKTDSGGNAVAVEHIDGEWAVIVKEGETIEQTMFVLESFARTFAVGQRLRLGLSTHNDSA